MSNDRTELLGDASPAEEQIGSSGAGRTRKRRSDTDHRWRGSLYSIATSGGKCGQSLTRYPVALTCVIMHVICLGKPREIWEIGVRDRFGTRSLLPAAGVPSQLARVHSDTNVASALGKISSSRAIQT